MLSVQTSPFSKFKKTDALKSQSLFFYTKLFLYLFFPKPYAGFLKFQTEKKEIKNILMDNNI